MPKKIINDFICDSHFHFGKFYDDYFSAKYIANFINNIGIKSIAISSTTICDESYKNVIQEFNELIEICGSRIKPILWITPNMLKSNNLDLFIESNIKWKVIKLHGYLHKWPLKGKHISTIISLAKRLNIPILLHTGGLERCDAASYCSLINKNPNLLFILAHGRPISETKTVLQKCQNAWVDTAFMPIGHILELLELDFEDRILYGSDFPITELYKDCEEDSSERYLKRITEIRSQLNEKQQNKLFYVNFQKLFCI